MNQELTCFKTYDIRGELGKNFNENICFQIGKAFSCFFNAKKIVVGHDSRDSSPALASSLKKGIISQGADVLDIGLAGTEEVYWATTRFGACGGLEVTASHNPSNYNGLKLVKSGSVPLSPINELPSLKELVQRNSFDKSLNVGKVLNYQEESKVEYVNKVIKFFDLNIQRPIKILFNSGNGAAGPVVDLLEKELSKKTSMLEFVHFNKEPDGTFPNGIPNPLLPENQVYTRNMVQETKADIGIAFDGDFDRCFFFDEFGNFVEGSYLVGLLAKYFLEKEKGAKIIYEPRVIWNTLDIIKKNQGNPISCKTGHVFIKQSMRENNAIYGGEISGHHYFRDFAFCDSGMIPWMVIIGIMQKEGKALSELVGEMRNKFPCSAEMNFSFNEPKLMIDKLVNFYRPSAVARDDLDGTSLSFDDWRFNVRASNTEPLVRLNVESKGNIELLNRKINEIKSLIET